MTSTSTACEPFGMRYAAGQTSAPIDSAGVTYDRELQIAVAADGNPWAFSAPNDTSSATNSDSRNDEGTDLW
ncbi:putative ATP-grasp-modified RiPP [Embleya sp. NPDC059237]|uniref:putative ATP-grasp-modified RiPP n=1 Tax=unclassified Embleya TaxID=2699296 RepID=UPI0036CFE95D